MDIWLQPILYTTCTLELLANFHIHTAKLTVCCWGSLSSCRLMYIGLAMGHTCAAKVIDSEQGCIPTYALQIPVKTMVTCSTCYNGCIENCHDSPLLLASQLVWQLQKGRRNPSCALTMYEVKMEHLPQTWDTSSLRLATSCLHSSYSVEMYFKQIQVT